MKDHQAQVEAQLKVWGAQLNLFKAKAEQAGVEARSDLAKTVEDLKALEASGLKHLEELKTVSVEAWADMKSSAMDKWKNLSSAMSALVAKLD